ncbi:hypothetical protein FNF27_07198 [Cafeteria roenbergensis]|uniref:Uncharacterized protein n=2 Tax=Cafeteria roenbergensis TaxID=33653 RepID=A0A5A8CKT3_CAFRO|nr:hypothetical protein FNF31_06574 [Cafeteria roenbergensis]KAA0168229.1 hypothetical protein FNF27_07198 [Cafeteria roenbergensis]
MADPMRRQEALRIVYGIQTTSVRRRTPPGMLGLRKAVWAWFRQVLTDEERAMVFCLVDRQWCLFVKDLFQSNADKNCDGVFVFANAQPKRRGSAGPRRSTSPAPRPSSKRMLVSPEGKTTSRVAESGSTASPLAQPMFISWKELEEAWAAHLKQQQRRARDAEPSEPEPEPEPEPEWQSAGMPGARPPLATSGPLADTSLPADMLAWRNASRRLQDCARLLDSRCGYDTLTLSKELLRNPVAAEAVLTDVSAGRFLTHQPPRDTITGMPRSMALQARRKGWSEYHRFAAPTSPASGAGCLPWYLSLPAHTVGSIVAHRLELALWHAFWEWQSTLHRAARPLLPRIPETGVAATRHPHDAAAAPAAATASTAAAAAAGAAPPYWCWCGRGRGMP